jgi:hypothetical protein
MWLALRAEDPHKAWRCVTDAEQHVLLALRTPVGPEFESALGARYAQFQMFLFPKMTFVSAGFNHDAGFCTICRASSTTCPHIKGRIYCGQVCAEYGFEKFEADHVAVVEYPMDKHCYVYATRREDGRWNRLSLRGRDERRM